ncbi:MAG: hypothetical protein IMZ40_01350, partial [Bacilli bacterium]|nr:hypothetical protein [Bacilli bacterium]
MRNRCSRSESSSASSALAYLDGGVTNSTPVAAGVVDSAAGCLGVDGESPGEVALPCPGVGDCGDCGESSPGLALPSPG